MDPLIKLPLYTLEKTRTGILYELPPGKPDPTQKCVPGKEKRERVPQKRLKDGTCWYYALNFLRPRIGKNPSDLLLTDRSEEKLCSERRKEQSAYNAAFPIALGNLYSKSSVSVLQSITLENVKEVLGWGIKPLTPYIKEFIETKNHSNFHEFLIFKRSCKMIEINMKFLRKIGKEKELRENQKWQSLDTTKKALVAEVWAQLFSAKLYGLKTSTWSPSKGILALIKELKEKGPLMVLGDIGKDYYTKPPLKMKRKIFTRNIYYWPAGSERQAFMSGHAVLLVGAKKVQDKAFVYFIDPSDPSDPRNRDKQKIYVISFTNLTSHIDSLNGSKQRLDAPSCWAYYGNFKI